MGLIDLEIKRNEDENRFECWIGDHLSKLDYIQDQSSLIITHVGVPVEFRGQGVAAALTKAALEYARSASLRVLPMCSYAAAYIRRNPEYADLTKPPK